MSDFQTVVSNIARYVHNPGDTVAVAECLLMALKALRGERHEWAEGTLAFVTEASVAEYPFGSYPGLPGGFFTFAVNPQVSYAAIAGAILQPDTLASSSNLTGDITDVQDSAGQPDENYLDPTTAAATSFEVRWDDDLERPLIPGAAKQIVRVAAYGEGTDRSVSWTVKEGGSTVVTGSFTVDGDVPAAYHIEWDAALLSTLDPAGEQISLLLEESTGTIHFGAVQWYTGTRVPDSVTGGLRTVTPVRPQGLHEYASGRTSVDAPGPLRYAIWNHRLLLDPAPTGSYYIRGDYQKDSTRDRETGVLLTTSSTTETNEWLDGAGHQRLLAKTLQIYYRLRPHDAKAASLADDVEAMGRMSDDLASGLEVFSHAPKGYL